MHGGRSSHVLCACRRRFRRDGALGGRPGKIVRVRSGRRPAANPGPDPMRPVPNTATWGPRATTRPPTHNARVLCDSLSIAPPARPSFHAQEGRAVQYLPTRETHERGSHPSRAGARSTPRRSRAEIQGLLARCQGRRRTRAHGQQDRGLGLEPPPQAGCKVLRMNSTDRRDERRRRHERRELDDAQCPDLPS
jgi:hypothetical protein